MSWDFYDGKWADSHGVGSRHILPAQLFPVALYLMSLVQTANTPVPVITAFCTIKCVQEICGKNVPIAS